MTATPGPGQQNWQPATGPGGSFGNPVVGAPDGTTLPYDNSGVNPAPPPNWGNQYTNAGIPQARALIPVIDPALIYVTPDEAKLFLSALPQSPGIVEWLALGGPEQTQSLRAATMVLDSLNWAGEKCVCDQKLQWPRRICGCPCGIRCDEIPYQIRLATAYMAAFMGEQGGFTAIASTAGVAGGGGVAGLEPFAEVTVGPIKVKMKEGTTYGDELTSNIGQIPPFVADLIRPFLNAFGMTQGYMGRRSIARAWGTYVGSPAYSGSMYLRGGRVYPRVGGWASDLEGRR